MTYRLSLSFETPTPEEWDFLTTAANDLVGRPCDVDVRDADGGALRMYTGLVRWRSATTMDTDPPRRDIEWYFTDRAEAEAAGDRLIAAHLSSV
jgi:hypothetical protein